LNAVGKIGENWWSMRWGMFSVDILNKIIKDTIKKISKRGVKSSFKGGWSSKLARNEKVLRKWLKAREHGYFRLFHERGEVVAKMKWRKLLSAFVGEFESWNTSRDSLGLETEKKNKSTNYDGIVVLVWFYWFSN
jgi:hypothetical protein